MKVNINKKLLALSVVLAAMGGCSIAQADTQTISLGYSQGKVTNFKDLRGVTAKYHYQPDGSLGFISSLTYMGADEKINDGGVKGKIQLKYYSLLVGPSYRVNEFVSLYGLVGARRFAFKGHSTDSAGTYISGKGSNIDFAYGAGVQITPAANWAVDIGYEGSRSKRMGSDGDSLKLNGFNIGLGYRF